MSRFTIDDKLRAVERYLTGKESYKNIAESIGTVKSLVITWVKLFEVQGKEGFKAGYTSYSSKFKRDVLNYMNDTGASLRETASTFNISSPSSIYRWEQLLKERRTGRARIKEKGASIYDEGNKQILGTC